MSTYTAIADAEINVDSPVTQILLTKYRENMLAIQQGDATAPRIQAAAIDSAQLTAYIVAALVAIPSGGVAYSGPMTEDVENAPARVIGDTLAGSNLKPISLRRASASVSAGINFLATSAAASGTWKLRTDYSATTSNNDYPVATWIRIS
jgi:hypothetical protein